MKRLIILAVLACALIATPAMAKEGFYLGGFIPITSIDGDSPDFIDNAYFNSLDPGIGFGLRAGYGFNEYLALEGSLFISFHPTDFGGFPNLENQDFTGQTLDLKLSLPLQESNVEPYFIAGIGAYQLGDSGGTYYKGAGFQLGFGLDIYVVPEVSLNGRLTFRDMTFDSGDLINPFFDVEAESTTLEFGFDYHF